MNQNYNRVSKKSARNCREKAISLLKKVQLELKSNKNEIIKFTYKLVGSGAWRIIVKDEKGWFDLDYQIFLTKKTKFDLEKPKEIKDKFFEAFKKYIDEKEKLNNSTTAITYINERHKYSIDFVIIKVFPKNEEIIRRNGQNQYTWNKLKEHNKMFSFFNSLNFKDKQLIIEKMVIPAKYNEKLKKENDQTLSSTEILLSKINEFKIAKDNNKLEELYKKYETKNSK